MSPRLAERRPAHGLERPSRLFRFEKWSESPSGGSLCQPSEYPLSDRLGLRNVAVEDHSLWQVQTAQPDDPLPVQRSAQLPVGMV